MESVDQLYVKIQATVSELKESESEQIINDMNKLKLAIYDTINESMDCEQLRQKYPFPTLIDSKNGILYARELTERRFFMIVLKESQLDAVIMEYNINAKPQPHIKELSEDNQENI